jgi:FAD/FMN-containing dehydrogenase
VYAHHLSYAAVLISPSLSASPAASSWAAATASSANAYGLAVDNALEFELVLPSGAIVTANARRNPDLFWALRGGGGGTFGVVTRVALRTHPSTSLDAVQLAVTARPGAAGRAAYARGMAELLGAMPAWTDWGLSGHPIMQADRINSLLTAPGKSSRAISMFLAPLAARLRALGLSVSMTPVAGVLNALLISRSAAMNAALPDIGEGDPGFMASRLWGRSGLADAAGLTTALVALFSKGYVLEPFPIAGGAVARNRAMNMSLNPAWREAIVHMSILPLQQKRLKTVGQVIKSYEQTMKDTMAFVDPFSVRSAAYINEVYLSQVVKRN